MIFLTLEPALVGVDVVVDVVVGVVVDVVVGVVVDVVVEECLGVAGLSGVASVFCILGGLPLFFGSPSLGVAFFFGVVSSPFCTLGGLPLFFLGGSSACFSVVLLALEVVVSEGLLVGSPSNRSGVSPSILKLPNSYSA